MAYGAAADVKTLSGVKPADLDLADEAALTAWLMARLGEITDWINQETRRDFEAEVAGGELLAVPAGIDGYANQIGRNVVAVCVAGRQTPVVRISQWRVEIADPALIADDIRAGLARYRKPLPVRITRVRSQAEIDAEASEA